MLGKALTLSTLAALIVVSFLLQSTNPSEAGPLTILLVFFLLYVGAVGATSWAIYGMSIILAAIAGAIRLKRSTQQLPMLHSYYYASVVALGPIMLLAIASVTQPGLYEVSLVTIFIVIAIFYVKKRLQ